MLGPTVQAANNPLTGWTQQGGDADWRVQPAGDNVTVVAPNPDTDNANGPTSFFVSPGNVGGTFEVTLSAETEEEEGDYIGFALGYQAPLGGAVCDVDDPCDTNFYLFDWKQTTELVQGAPEPPENGGQEGFSLMRVRGARDLQNNNTLDRPACFWTHQDVDNFCDVLDTEYGATQGYDYGIGYTFQVTYTPTLMRITLLGTGANAVNRVIFSQTPPTGTQFPAGRFAFYNYSQPKVNYGLDDGTVADTTTTTTTTTIATTTTTAAAGSGTTTPPTVGPVLRSTLVRTGQDDLLTMVELAGGAALLLIGAVLTATRGKRPEGAYYLR